MEDGETTRIHNYGESKTTRIMIMMAPVPHVCTACLWNIWTGRQNPWKISLVSSGCQRATEQVRGKILIQFRIDIECELMT